MLNITTIKSLESEGIRVDLEFRTIALDGRPLDPPLAAQELDALVRLFASEGKKLRPRDILPSSSATNINKAVAVILAKANAKLERRLSVALEHISGSEHVIDGFVWTATVRIEYLDTAVETTPRGHLPVFPIIPRVGSSGYFLSVVTVGAADKLSHAREFSTRQNSWIDTIPCVHDGGPILRMDFEHNNSAPGAECWWSAVVGLDQHRLLADWLPVDLTQYSKITVDGRATFRPGEKRVPLLLRLEDASADGSAGSFHHSTDWADLWFPPTFSMLEIRFDAFRWDRSAWWWNRHDVDRKSVLQLTFGHDKSVDSSAGTFDLRGISIE